MKQVTAVVIGAGLRGADAYASYALQYPNELRITAVAEPDRKKREEFATLHQIPAEYQFAGYEEILEQPQLADCALICTMDTMHYEPVIKALKKGYHVLCEKPMSPNKDEIIAMGKASETYQRALVICHVLRYSPFFGKLKELLEQKRIGQLINIRHTENVGFWHQAHSFVRGNWRNSEETSPMIVQKCCHDMDILLWLTGSHCSKISSFGSLTYFKEENAPEGAPAYCMDGCTHREDCPYYAPKFYLGHGPGRPDMLVRAVCREDRPEAILHALEKGPYGRCVFRCDNTVVDHQVVNLEFENGVSASLTMCAFTSECERDIILMGTRGEILGNMEKGEIEIRDFVTGNTEKIQLFSTEGGHSGSDEGLMRNFVQLMAEGQVVDARSGAAQSVESHLMALAAEESRITGKVINL